MIPRQATKELEKLAKGFPVISITGPRQSGKTTLAQACFADRPYVNLESPAERALAIDDPVGFLSRFPDGAILDEIQHAPDLFSYLQVQVDRDGRMCRFIITGSQQFGLNERISQSLAGRVGALTLLPFSQGELKAAGRSPASLDEQLQKGCFPPLYDREVDPATWCANYEQTYLERDLRQMSTIHDLNTFQRFLRLCAGRTGQLVNRASLASDAGISPTTVGNWLTLLEASFIIKMLRPHHRNFNKRLVKSPKLYFTDTGLAASLLGISDPSQITTHPLRGPLFETFVFNELLKGLLNAGLRANLSFWRDNHGHEVDFLLENGDRLAAIEVKAGATVVPKTLKGLDHFAKMADQEERLELTSFLVHGGRQDGVVHGIQLLPWDEVSQAL